MSLSCPLTSLSLRNNLDIAKKMKANVQYNDYRGTTAADRSDFLETNIVKMSEIIINRFDIPLAEEGHQFVGVSVYGTNVNDVCATFYFKNIETKEVVKYFKSLVELQAILDLFKRFEFQVGEHLEDIDIEAVKEIEF